MRRDKFPKKISKDIFTQKTQVTECLERKPQHGGHGPSGPGLNPPLQQNVKLPQGHTVEVGQRAACRKAAIRCNN